MPAFFAPPIVNIVPPVNAESKGLARRLFRYFGPWPQGLSVLYLAGHYVTVENPSQDQLEGLVEGVTYFLGGHEYIVSDAVADALLADGYSATDVYLGLESSGALLNEFGDPILPES